MDHLVHKKIGGPCGNKAQGAVHGSGCNLNRVGSGSWNMPCGRMKEEGSAGYQTQGANGFVAHEQGKWSLGARRFLLWYDADAVTNLDVKRF